MRIKTYNKRKSKNNLIKFQTSSKILKCSVLRWIKDILISKLV